MRKAIQAKRQKPALKELFIANRARLRERLSPNSLVIVNANDILPTSADGTLPMQLNPDLFYLSGITQEQSILVLAPDAQDERMQEMLFLRQPSELSRIWEGSKHTQEEAQEISGIRTIRWVEEFPKTFHRLMCEADCVYLDSNEHPSATFDVASRESRFVRQTLDRYPLHQYRRLAPILGELRSTKTKSEIELIERAIAITKSGFDRVLRHLSSGMNECEIEAIFAHEFIRQGSRFAYTPIVAGGPNTCVLHYTDNNRTLRDKELVLLDIGARFSNYNADVTRTYPVNGRFTRRQRTVYEAVLRVLRASIRGAVKGKIHRDWQKEVELLMQEELLQLGLLKPLQVKDPERAAMKKYFMHGAGHPLGLDIHDVYSANRPFAPGWVLTVEPGIYIAEEGLGVRLEEDILITENDPINLTEAIPIEPDEVERVMGRARRHR